MKLKILQAGTYNDANHQAGEYAEGEILSTSEPYGLLLLQAGLAEEVQPEPEQEPDTQTDDKPQGKPASVRRNQKRGNPFAPAA
jgi:hypothetical protein